MSLQEQIQQFTNSAEFARLVNGLFVAEYRQDYQIVDGTRGDDGNDGYLRSEQRILAVYCPSKPERRTDRDYVEKGLSDLRKAADLRDSGAFEIRRWTLITPRALKNSVLMELVRSGERLGLEANHLEGSYLAELLLRHQHLLPEFPQLHASRLEELVLRAIGEKESIAEPVKAGAPDQFDEIEDLIRVHEGAAGTEQLGQVLRFRKSDDTAAARVELRALCLGSGDPHVQLNALFGLFDLYDPSQDSNEDLAGLAGSLIPVARRINSRAAEAYILAFRGYFLSAEVNIYAIRNIPAYLFGLPWMAASKNLATINRDANQAMISSLEMAMELRSPKTLAAVLLQIGTTIGQRALMFKSIGDTEAAKAAISACRTQLLAAKNISAELGDDYGTANATLNLINQLRFFGDTDALKLMLPEVIRVAEKYRDERLLRKANTLRERLETGVIPDYQIPRSWSE
jgi:hypothetical protein